MDNAAGGESPRRLFVFNGGFLTQGRVRRILELSGWNISLGKPGAKDWVGVWGKSPTSPRGEAVASATDAHILRVEDSFLRSVHPGRDGEAPIGLNIDKTGVHFDSSAPSDLETLLATAALDDAAVLNRGRDALARIRRAHLSKYNAFDPEHELPKAPYVLVIDQSRGDASIEHGGANAATFAEMLVFALTEHPGNRIVIKGHPETAAGHRDGHFSVNDETDRVTYLADPVSPWALMEGATAVYTVSSQLGFEAIFAGHKPRVFGQPFYSGWGLTLDENPVARRERKLTRAQLFAGSMILYPTWYDPTRDQICPLEDAISALEAKVRAWREDRAGYTALGMRRWKRPHLNRFFGQSQRVRYVSSPEKALLSARTGGRNLLVWASHADGLGDTGDVPVIRVEDGFIRSRGLGAGLVAPLSLVADDLGIYYDPNRESRLERLITASVNLDTGALLRAEKLMRQISRAGISKYNLDPAPLPDLPDGKKILVPGQVEDDASILKGCGDISCNIDLLARTRADNPAAVIIYKPHPDVEAGLREGKLTEQDALKYADLVVNNADPAALLAQVNEVWTMTSLLGFEALIRGVPVTCVGAPFYAGWGLTRDLGDVPKRRVARPELAAFVHACLIDYPRYVDPISGRPCSVELVLERLTNGGIPPAGRWNRVLAKLQGIVGGGRRRG